MLRDLKVPYALDSSGTVVAALTAPHDASYTCLECGQLLTVRRRRGHRPHFTHHSNALRNCTGESVIHQAAKALLRVQVEQEIREHNAVTWHLACPGAQDACRDHATFQQHHRIDAWEKVALEITHGPYRFDVAVTNGGIVVFGFEVYFRHEVPDEKAAALDVPWLELSAEEILAYQPRLPYRNRRAPTHCPACAALAARLAERAADNHARNQVEAEYHAEAQRIGQTWNSILATARTQSKKIAAARRRGQESAKESL